MINGAGRLVKLGICSYHRILSQFLRFGSPREGSLSLLLFCQDLFFGFSHNIYRQFLQQERKREMNIK